MERIKTRCIRTVFIRSIEVIHIFIQITRENKKKFQSMNDNAGWYYNWIKYQSSHQGHQLTMTFARWLQHCEPENIFYHDGAVRNLGILFSSANRRPRLPWRPHWKAVHCRSTTHGWLCKFDRSRSPGGFPDSIVIFRFTDWTANFRYSLDIHNDGINPFTLSNFVFIWKFFIT